jgi:hypothetical protein
VSVIAVAELALAVSEIERKLPPPLPPPPPPPPPPQAASANAARNATSRRPEQAFSIYFISLTPRIDSLEIVDMPDPDFMIET